MVRRINSVYQALAKPNALGNSPRITPRLWHREVFDGLPPVAYYAGHYRGFDAARPCLFQDVQFGQNGKHKGTAKIHVRGEMSRLQFRYVKWLEELDRRQQSVSIVPSTKRAECVLLIALAVAQFIQVHPFINGNGRTSRIIINFFLIRFGMRPMQDYPRPPDPYLSVLDVALSGQYAPLCDYILTSAYPIRSST